MIINEIEYIEIEGVPYKKTTYYDETEGGEKWEVASVTEPVQTEQFIPEPENNLTTIAEKQAEQDEIIAAFLGI